jgi:hypothetical protein
MDVIAVPVLDIEIDMLALTAFYESIPELFLLRADEVIE